ncbi:hypothetical protein SMD44_07557 [Streptomyces alboflavus]|uniref:Uncharacterized protein n=1 Tax=Streptomyces alboflavus TaxID=67267 RepID=A0A1Z1WNW2_9ACTN|nr:hypothetical protein SMD44_07557 [Streptomyces alboflavus]
MVSGAPGSRGTAYRQELVDVRRIDRPCAQRRAEGEEPFPGRASAARSAASRMATAAAS